MRNTAAALAIMAFVAVSNGPAFAADLIVEEAAPVTAQDWGSFYLKVYGGTTLESTLSWDGSDYDMEAGWLVGGAVGMEVFTPGLSIELDVTASKANYGDDTFLSGSTVMADLVYTAALTDTFSAYLGAGLGIVGAQYEDYDFGYGAGGQAFAGLSLDLTENVSVFGEARFQSAFDTIEADGYDLEFSRTAVLAGIKLSN